MTDWMREQAYEMGDESAYFPDEEGAAMTPLSIDSDERKKDESIWVVESDSDGEWHVLEHHMVRDDAMYAMAWFDRNSASRGLGYSYRVRRYVPAHDGQDAEPEGKAAAE